MQQVRPGAEAWAADGSGANADIGVLLLHGFTGSPASLRPLAEDLAERGFTVELPLLPGHGTHWKDLHRTTWQDLARATVQSFESLRARTRAQVVMGLSGGALIGLRLAQTRQDDLAGLVMVNPWTFTDDPRAKILPWFKMVLPSIPGVINDIAKPGMDEVGYDRLPIRSAASIQQLQKQVRRDLAKVTLPALLLTSRQDRVVSTKCSDEIAANISSDDFEHIWLERSYHVATLDHDYPVILESTAKFAERVGRREP